MNAIRWILLLSLLAAVVPFDARADDASVTNVTAILRQAIRQLQKIGQGNSITPESAPKSFRECRMGGGLTFDARCNEVNGRFRYRCAYRSAPESECAWHVRTRKTGDVLRYAAFDRSENWALLARAPGAVSFEDVLAVLGKPYRSRRLDCRNCGMCDMRWDYVIYDLGGGGTIRHTLTFSFSPDGRCAGWAWLAECCGSFNTQSILL